MPSFRKDGAVKHKYLWWCHERNRAIRQGDWKLTARRVDDKVGPWELYNLKSDRSETNNLTAKYPGKVKRLSKLWEKIADGFKKDLAKE